MPGSAVSVRPARPADRRALAAVLARSFFDDPVTAWFYPDDRTRLRHARRFFAIRLRYLAAVGRVDTTDDLAGAALWAPPGRWREEGLDALRYLATLPAILPRLGVAMRAMRVIEDRHPSEPHLYLSALGAEPARQGGGVGSALLAAGLRHADGHGLPCYLESSKQRNVGLYRRHGFEVRQTLCLPDGGPTLWLMWRAPRA